MTTETNKILFDEQIKAPCIVDFYETGCPTCEKLAPVFEDLSQQYDSLLFLKVNLDEDITLAERYGVSHVPALIVFEEGKPVRVSIGYLDKAALSAFIEEGSKEMNA